MNDALWLVGLENQFEQCAVARWSDDEQLDVAVVFQLNDAEGVTEGVEHVVVFDAVPSGTAPHLHCKRYLYKVALSREHLQAVWGPSTAPPRAMPFLTADRLGMLP